MQRFFSKFTTAAREERSANATSEATPGGGLAWFLTPSTAECEGSGSMTPIGMLQSQNSGSGVQAPPPIAIGDGAAPGSTLRGYASQSALDPQAVAQQQQQAQAEVQYTWDGRTNPGQFDKADKEAVQILKPDIFDGCRFEHNRLLGPNFTVSHSLWLGSAMLQSGNHYQFGSTVVLNEGTTMLLGRIDPEGRLDAQWHQEYVQPQKVLSRVQASISPQKEQNMTQASLEVNGIDYAGTLKLVTGPMFGLSYFQSVTKALSMGAEAFYHHGQGASHIVARSRYADGNDIATATLTTMGTVSANYVRKVSERVSLASEIQVSLADRQSSMNVGYEFLLRTSKLSGVVSTEGVIQSQIQEMLVPGLSIIFNAILDHKHNQHRFGYGVQMG